jgi:hypothetical protein
MVLTLRSLLAALGLAAVCICLSILLYGPANTANSFEALFNALTGLNYPVTGAWPPTMDSELRFYAPLWGAYGFILIAVAPKPASDASLRAAVGCEIFLWWSRSRPILFPSRTTASILRFLDGD